MTLDRITNIIGMAFAYFLICVVGFVWLIVMFITYAVCGAYDEIKTGLPREWASIVRQWRKI